MKIKWDFVTNSSSTCYILRSRVSGHLPVYRKKYKFLESFYPDQFIYDHYAYINENKNLEEDAIVKGLQSYNAQFVLKNTTDWDEANQSTIPMTLFRLTLDNSNPYDYPQLDLTKELLERFLLKQLGVDVSFQLLYEAHVLETSGDGWDGGDASMGPSELYAFRHDLYKGETKVGILTVLQNNIIDEIYGIGDSMSFNEMVLKNINKSGAIIEGTK